MKFSRRNFLKGAGAALAAAFVPKGKEAAPEQEQIVVLDEHKSEGSYWERAGKSYIDGYCEGLNVWTEALENMAEDGTIEIDLGDDDFWGYVRKPDGSIDVIGTIKMRLERARDLSGDQAYITADVSYADTYAQNGELTFEDIERVRSKLRSLWPMEGVESELPYLEKATEEFINAREEYARTLSVDVTGTIEEQVIGGEKRNAITSIDSVEGVNVEGEEYVPFLIDPDLPIVDWIPRSVLEGNLSFDLKPAQEQVMAIDHKEIWYTHDYGKTWHKVSDDEPL